ncbi:MAG: choice-of-anchor J domain-containing protein [Xanthomarina sp.]
MKKITLLSFSLLFSYAMSAQVVVWSEDFNDEDLSDWTLIDADGDGRNWGDIFQVTTGAPDNTPVTPVSLISRSWQQSPLTPDNWAISPAIDLTGASGTITVEWITQVPAAPWDAEKYSIHVGTTNNTFDLVASPTSLTQTLGDAGHTGTPINQTLDISSLAGEAQVYIAFRHWDSTDNDFISIDDVVVTAQTVLSVQDVALNSMFIGCKNRVLTISNIEGGGNYRVLSITGQDLLSGNIRLETQNIDVSKLASGIYIVEVTAANSNAQKTKKIVIE